MCARICTARRDSCEQGAAMRDREIGGGRPGGGGGEGGEPTGRWSAWTPRRGKLRILRVPTARVHLPSPLCHPVAATAGLYKNGVVRAKAPFAH